MREAIEKIEKEEREEINMCKLFDDIREEGRKEGREEGRVSGAIFILRNLKYADGEIINHLITELNISKEKAKEYVG